MKRKKSFFSEQYSKSWKYIKDCKNFIYVSILIFVVFAFVGYFVPVPLEITEKILQFIQELLVQTENLSAFGLMRFIFLNNLQSSFFAVILGFVLGIFPVLSAVSNGFLVGFVALLTVKERGLWVLFTLVPHGIFELPAIFISMGMGIKFGSFVFQKDKLKSFRKFLINSLRVFIFVVLPLLIVAAIIEGAFIAFT